MFDIKGFSKLIKIKLDKVNRGRYTPSVLFSRGGILHKYTIVYYS